MGNSLRHHQNDCPQPQPQPQLQPQPQHGTNLLDLPESCIFHILTFTSPRDISRLAVVSKQLRSMAYSDVVWQKFLPRQCGQIKKRAVPPLEFPSKRELYFRLCDSVFIDKGRKRFWLERSTAKVGYMLSARDLFIVWGQDERYWRWVSRDDSRFKEVAELLKVCWLEIKGQINRSHLSANTNYRVVFVFKFNEEASGWSRAPINFSVKTPDGKETKKQQVLDGGAKDRWTKMVAGEFSVRAAEGDGNEPASVEFGMEEVVNGNTKCGLLIDGVRIEPKTI